MADEVNNLSVKSRKIVEDSSNDLFLSSISLWEITNKYKQGKLHLHQEPYSFIKTVSEKFNLQELPFNFLSCRYLQSVPYLHKDPFDRMLICQAIENGLAIVTDDKVIASYPIKTIW